MQIKLTNSDKHFEIDEQDLGLLGDNSWFLDNEGYVGANTSRRLVGGKKRLRLHRVIMAAKPGQIVDHINRNRLDNRRNNLRFVTASQNTKNTSARGASEYIGVSRKRNKWRAHMSKNGDYLHIGHFEKERHAALAHDLWVMDDEYATLNFKPVIKS